MSQLSNCEAKQFSDQMFCEKCDISFDINDPNPPKCKTRKFKRGESCFFIRKNVGFLYSKKITKLNPVHEIQIHKMVIKVLKKNGNYEVIGGDEYQEKHLLNYEELLIQIERLK